MIRDEAKKFITEQAKKRMALLGLEDHSVSNSTDLVKEGIFDSLSFVDLVADCENEFNIQIDLEKYEPGEFTKLGKLAEIIENAKNSL
ncbi:MAG: acyl carrier protein [Bacteroidia bacterium]|nr:acyl carrier protein [Bacteroidia bacterium]